MRRLLALGLDDLEPCDYLLALTVTDDVTSATREVREPSLWLPR